eukprot:CAMPEP_0184553018 /NCGR_PEP_ID=MMETSP0199_2-20130426/30651_1 /TAXON_ID=1112570 /ORGANISM="Thraustochytrium sp., Strain LLF1b" /LENGTH=30 /DNA_ID= /DNA_START= /DNA_END= /DNA_ORIENTATION=
MTTVATLNAHTRSVRAPPGLGIEIGLRPIP